MIAGTIGVTLELNDRTFSVRIEKAGKSIRQLAGNLTDAGKAAEAFGASLRKALSANVAQDLTKLGTAQSRAAALAVAANARVTASANQLKAAQVSAAAAAATAAANAAAAQTRAAAVTTAANARIVASANNLQAAQARAAAATTAAANRATRNVQVQASQARSFLGTMRDVTIVAGMLPTALATAQTALTGWFSGVIKTNAEIERMTFLMKGMSRAATEAGQWEEARQNVQWLFDLAGRAPFQVDALSDTFVKLKSVGLDPTTGSMNSLTDAVAAFGGKSENLERAAVAIQQMAGKGVISMEELRQQLGEAVPTAINLMARSMGMTYGQLVEKISNGSVQSQDALARMFGEFERVYGGAAQAQMRTFNGLVAQLQTKWTEFQLEVGRTGAFQDAKDQLQGVVDAMDGQQVAQFAKLYGEAIKTAIGAARDLAEVLYANRDAIEFAGKALLTYFVASRGIQGVTALTRAFTALRGNVGLLTGATQTYSSVATIATARMATLGGAANSLGRATSIAAAGLTTLGRVAGAIAGPLGFAATLLISAASAAGLFRDRYREAMNTVRDGDLFTSKKELEDARAGLDDINGQLQLYGDIVAGLEGKSALSGLQQAELKSARDKIVELQQQRAALEKTVAQSERYVSSTDTERKVSQRVRLIADMETKVRNEYRATMEEQDRLANAGTISQEEYNRSRLEAMNRLTDGLSAVYRQAIDEQRTALATATKEDAAVISGVIAELQERLNRITAQAAAQRELQAKPPTFVAPTSDSPAQQRDSDRLENRLDQMRAKASQLRAALADTGTELAKWTTLFKEGQFANASDATKTKILQAAAELDELDALRAKATEAANARASARQEVETIAEQTRAIRRGFMDRAAAGQDYLNSEIDRLRRLLEATELTGAERKRAEADVQAYVAALREQTARETESQVDALLRHWSDGTERMGNATANWLQDATDNLAEFATTGKLNIRDFAESVIRDIIRIRMQANIAEKASGWLGSLMDKAASVILGGIGGSAAPSAQYANMGGGGYELHTGGVPGLDTAWMGAPRYHTGTGGAGLRSDEMRAVLQVGEGVFTKGQMKAMGMMGNLALNTPMMIDAAIGRALNGTAPHGIAMNAERGTAPPSDAATHLRRDP